MRPNSFYRKEMMLFLFLLLGVNSSWRWLDSTKEDKNLALKKEALTGMAEFSITDQTAKPTSDKSVAAPTKVKTIIKKEKCKFGFFYCEDEVVSETIADEPSAKVEKSAEVKPTVNDSIIVTVKENGKDKEYKVKTHVNEGHNSKYTIANVVATEAQPNCQNCEMTFKYDKVFDFSKAEDLQEFSVEVKEKIEAKAKAAKLAADSGKSKPSKETTSEEATSAEEETDTVVAKVDAGKTEAAAKEESESAGDDEVADNKLEAILKKCEADSIAEINRLYVRCLVNGMKAFNKTEKNKEDKLAVFEELYDGHIKEKLAELLDSEKSSENKVGKNIALELRKLLKEKDSASIRNDIRDMVVNSEKKRASAEIGEDINTSAKNAASAYLDFQDALKNNDRETANTRMRDYEVAMRELLLMKFATDSKSMRGEPIWNNISRFYDEGSYSEVDKLVRGIYTSADKYRDGLYDTLVRGQSIDSLINTDPLALASGVSGILGSNSGIIGQGLNGGDRFARDNARGMFGSNFSNTALLGNSQGILRTGPQYSSFNPTSFSRPSFLTSGNFGSSIGSNFSNNGPFYDWGSVRPDPTLGNMNSLYSNNIINRPIYSGNSAIGGQTYPAVGQTWGPGNFSFANNNSYIQPNCYYNSINPVGYNSSNCNSYSGSASGIYNMPYNNSGYRSGGRFGP
jgi:hypothetical protein